MAKKTSNNYFGGIRQTLKQPEETRVIEPEDEIVDKAAETAPVIKNVKQAEPRKTVKAEEKKVDKAETKKNSVGRPGKRKPGDKQKSFFLEGDLQTAVRKMLKYGDSEGDLLNQLIREALIARGKIEE